MKATYGPTWCKIEWMNSMTDGVDVKSWFGLATDVIIDLFETGIASISEFHEAMEELIRLIAESHRYN